MIGGAVGRIVCLAQSCPVLLCLLAVMALTSVVQAMYKLNSCFVLGISRVLTFRLGNQHLAMKRKRMVSVAQP